MLLEHTCMAYLTVFYGVKSFGEQSTAALIVPLLPCCPMTQNLPQSYINIYLCGFALLQLPYGDILLIFA